MQHLFDLGDLVEIDDSCVIGEVVGLKIEFGNEDSYLISYHDNSGNPQRKWWPASSLDSADEPDNDNVVCFDCAKAQREAANATKH